MKKSLIFTLAFAFSMTAQATTECVGTGQSANARMSILDLARREVREGEKNPVAVRIVEKRKVKSYVEEVVLFAGVVEGVTEDVQWFLKSKDRNTFFRGTLYLDEFEQSVYLGGKEMIFTCEQE